MTAYEHVPTLPASFGLVERRYRLMATTALATALLAAATPAWAQQTVVDNTDEIYDSQNLDGLRVINDGSVYGTNLTIGQNGDDEAGVRVLQGHAELVGGSVTQEGTGKYVSGIIVGSNGRDTTGAINGTVDVSDMTITVDGGKDAGGLFVNGQNARIEADGVSIELTATGSSTAEPAAALKARAGTIEIANSAVEVTGDTVFGILTAAYAPVASVVSIENDITTWGDRGYGAFAYSNPDSATQSNESHIDIHGGTLTTGGERAYGLVAQGSLSTVSTSGGLELTTSGERAYGAYAVYGATIDLTDTDILTEGLWAHGLHASGAGDEEISRITFSGGSIITANDKGQFTQDGDGSRAYAILAEGVGAEITVNDTAIRTYGQRAYGAHALGGATVDLTDVNIETDGFMAYGIYASGSGSVVNAQDVDITTNGQVGDAAWAYNGGRLEIHGGTYRVRGEANPGAGETANGLMALGGTDGEDDGVIVARGLTVIAEGGGSSGLKAGSMVGADYTSGQISLFDSDITVNGAGSQAVAVSYGSHVETENSTLASAQGAGIVLRENSTVVLNDTTLTSAEESFRSILTQAGREQTITVGAGSEVITNNGTLLLVERSADGADGEVELVLEAGSTSRGDILDEGERSEAGGTDVTLEEGASWTGILRGIRNFFAEGEVEAEFEDDAEFTGDFTTETGSRYSFAGDATFGGKVEAEGSDFVFNENSDVVITDGVTAQTSTFDFGDSGTTTIVGNVNARDSVFSFGRGASTKIEGSVLLTEGSRTTGGTVETPIQLIGGVDVDGSSIMGGNWIIGGDLVNQGTLTPGNSIGVVTVEGGVTFDVGSTYDVEIAGGGSTAGVHNDFLDVRGEATLNGGTVTVTALDAQTSYTNGTTYTILSAEDGVSGRFADEAVSRSIFIDPTLDYDEENVFLTIALTDDFPRYAQTSNQVQAATALNDLEQSGDALAVYNAIIGASTSEAEARRIFDLTSGQAHASAQNVVNRTFSQFSRALHQHGAAGIQELLADNAISTSLSYGPVMTVAADAVVAIDDVAPVYTDQRVQRAWVSPMGGGGSVDGDGNAAGLEWWGGGLAGGYEGELDIAVGQAFGGFGMGYMRSRTTVDDLASTVDADTFQLGVYGGWADGPWTVSGSLGYAASHLDTSRNIVFGTIDRTAEASYWAHSLGFSGEAAYGIALDETTTLSPLATLGAGWSGHGGFSETGAGALNLTGASESWTRLDTGLGVALQRVMPTDNGQVALQGRVVWEHAFSDVAANQSLSLEGSPTGFAVSSPDASRDRLRLGGGIAWNASDEMTLRADYEGLFSSDEQSHGASFGLNVSF